MIKKQIEQAVQERNALFPVEAAYAQKHSLLDSNGHIEEKQWTFSVVERCLKETEEVAATEDSSFMNQKVSYLYDHMDEFLYVESPHFELIGLDGLSMEVDDLFGTFTVLFGLRVQKRTRPAIEAFFESIAENNAVNMLFSADEGIWDMNVALDSLPDFTKDMTLTDAVDLAYKTVFNLTASLEETK